MKKKIIVVVVLLLVIPIVIFTYKTTSMSALPDGELIATYQSEYSDCILNVYICNGGATTDYAIRGEVVYANGKEKNIYWEYHRSEAQVEWIDAENVIINGRILNVYEDIYDWRKEL